MMSQKKRLDDEHKTELEKRDSRTISRQGSKTFSAEYLSALGVDLEENGDLDPEAQAEIHKRGITHLLRGIPLFHSLPPEKLNALKGSLTERHCVDDEVIIKKGDLQNIAMLL